MVVKGSSDDGLDDGWGEKFDRTVEQQIDWEARREAARNQVLPPMWWDNPGHDPNAPLADFIHRATSAQAAVDKIIGEQDPEPVGERDSLAADLRLARDIGLNHHALPDWLVEHGWRKEGQALGYVVAQQSPLGAAAAGAVGLAGWVFATEEEARQALADSRLLGWRIARLVVR
jgi:hypothetical protein